jgi:hypothetical protein
MGLPNLSGHNFFIIGLILILQLGGCSGKRALSDAVDKH